MQEKDAGIENQLADAIKSLKGIRAVYAYNFQGYCYDWRINLALLKLQSNLL